MGRVLPCSSTKGQATVCGFCARTTVGFRACGAPHFLLLRQKKVRKEKATRRQRPAAQGSLRYSSLAGAAELGLRPQTVLALFPPTPPLLGAVDGKGRTIMYSSAPNSTVTPDKVIRRSAGYAVTPFRAPCETLSNAGLGG